MPTFRNKKLATEAAGPKPKVMPKKKGIAAKVAAGVPLIASASGVKGGRGANRVFGALTGVTAAKKGVKVDPLGVAMALPVGKVLLAASKLRAAGKLTEAISLEARAAAKRAGQIFGGSERGLPTDRAVDVGGRARMASERLFPRLPNVGGDSPRLLRGSRDLRTFDTYADLTNEGAGRFTRRASKLVYPRQTGMPEAGSVAMVKKTAAQFGQKVGSKEAKNISRLLRGRTSK